MSCWNKLQDDQQIHMQRSRVFKLQKQLARRQRGKNELCWGWWGEHTEKNRKYTPGNTAGGGNEDKRHSQHWRALESGKRILDFLRQLFWVSISKALMSLLHLSIEQVGSGLHYVHQNSHWTPAKFVSQRIVWTFRSWKATAVGNIRFNL